MSTTATKTAPATAETKAANALDVKVRKAIAQAKANGIHKLVTPLGLDRVTRRTELNLQRVKFVNLETLDLLAHLGPGSPENEIDRKLSASVERHPAGRRRSPRRADTGTQTTLAV